MNKKITFSTPITEAQKHQSTGEFKIKGTAINATITRNKTKFLPEELKKSAQTLIGKPLLKNHSNDIDSIMGTVDHAEYDEKTQSVLFEATIDEESYQQKITKGRIKNVSIGATVERVQEDYDDNGKLESYTVYGIDFVELSMVAVPADPGAGFTKAVLEAFNMTEEKNTTSNATTVVTGQSTNTVLQAPEQPVQVNEDTMAEENKLETLRAERQALEIEKEMLLAEKAKLELDLEKQAVEKLKAQQTPSVTDQTTGEVTTQTTTAPVGPHIFTREGMMGLGVTTNDYAQHQTLKRLVR